MANSPAPGRGHAALLIDLENFYLGREELARESGATEGYDFATDLEALVRFAEELAQGRRMSVRRAYADYNAARRADDRWDYYLRLCAKLVMGQGIEPVQCFRFPGGSKKNAADMRLAMDATAMMSGNTGIDQFVLVTGDADFIPVVIELRLRGARCAVIGVSGRTKPVFQRYCDAFEYFEDLVAAEQVEGPPDKIREVRAALQGIFVKQRPLVFAAVKPILSKALGHTFDPSRFDCENTGEFLRKFAIDLGIVVQRGEHDWTIDVAPAGAGGAAPPSSPANPTAGLPAPGVQAPVAQAIGMHTGGGLAASPSSATRGRPPRHEVAEYRWLLRMRTPKVHVVEHDDWLRITEMLFDSVRDIDGKPIQVLHASLIEDLTQQCVQEDIEAADKKVQSVAFQLFKGGVFVCDAAGVAGSRDFHWSKPAHLAPEIQSLAELRRAADLYIATLLLQRMREAYGTDEVDAEVLAELLDGPEPSEDRIQAIEDLLDVAAEAIEPPHD